MKRNNSFIISLALIIFIPVICYFVFFNLMSDKFLHSPKIYGERKGVEKKMVGGKEQTDTIYHTIPDFKMVNQNGDTITQDFFEGKIYVADFFYGTCKTICPRMSSQMARLQGMFNPEKNINIRMISFTVDPATDTVASLKRYADNYQANDTIWQIVTGEKEAIYEVARKGFLLPVQEGDGGEEDFIHSDRFVLVDKDKHIRGFYNGTDSADVKKLADDIVLLHLIEQKKNRKHFLD